MTLTRRRRRELQETPQARRAARRFVVLFLLLLLAGNILFAVPWFEDRVVDPWTRLNARASAAAAGWVGVAARVEGTRVWSGRASLDILQGCNGMHALLILLSAILAFPAPWPRRLLGVAGGVAGILGFNLVRLVNLIVVARHVPERLELFHVWIWQPLIVLIALGLFVLWGQLAGNAARADA